MDESADMGNSGQAPEGGGPVKPETNTARRRGMSGCRPWAHRILLALFAPLLLASAEVFLRTAGVAPPNRGDPFLERLSVGRLYRPGRLPDGRAGYVPVGQGGNGFNFPAFPARKGPRTLRMGVVGGSATAGHPLAGHVAFPEWLRVGLEAAYGDRPVEMLNCAICGATLGQMATVAGELLEHDLDALIVSSGNNEYRGSHTYRAVRRLGKGMGMLRSLAARLALVRWARRALGLDDSTLRWGFVAGAHEVQVAAHSEAEKRLILDNYRYGLNVIRDSAGKAGVSTVVCTVPANESDWVPFGWARSRPLTPAEAADWDRKADAIAAMIRDGKPDLAAAGCRSMLARDDRPALLHYLLGSACEAMEDYEGARRAYAQALELDVVRNRAFGSLNATLRDFCARRQVPCVDGVEAVRRACPNGLIGWESFHDNCHPRTRTHRVVSVELARVLVETGVIPAPAPGWESRFTAAQDAYDRDLAVPRSLLAAGHMRVAKSLLEAASYRLVHQELAAAENLLRKALELDGTLYSARFYLGVTAFLLDKPREAEQAWQESARRDPACSEALVALRDLRRGTLSKAHLLVKKTFNLPERPIESGEAGR